MRNIGFIGKALCYLLAVVAGASLAVYQVHVQSLRTKAEKPVQSATAYIVPQIIYEETVTMEEEDDGSDVLIARVVMAEAGNQPFVGKVAVAMVILNRMDMYGQTADEVVYADNQFASPAKICSEECVKAVEFAKENRELFPGNMIYFRANYYHSFGEPFVTVGDHYFSLEVSNEG